MSTSNLQPIAAYASPCADVVCDALDSLRVAITVFDRERRLIHANVHLGYMFRSLPAPDALIGLTYEDLIRELVGSGEIAHDKADVKAFIAYCAAQLRDGEYHPRDIRLVDGRIAEIKVRRTRQDGWIALWSDVTQARHTLWRMEDAVEMSADAFVFYDSSDHVVRCNAELARIMKEPSPEALVGAHLKDVMRRAADRNVPVMTEAARKWIDEALNGDQHPARLASFETNSGQTYVVRDRYTRDGGRAVVFTDITDSSRTQAALTEQTKSLERLRAALEQSQSAAERQARYLSDLTEKLGAAKAEAGTAKTTLLRTMSHELKTPLNAIIGFADLLRISAGRLKPAEISEYATLIHAGGLNLLRLLNQIMDLTRIAAGRYELRRQKLDLSDCIRAVCDSAAERAEAKAITLNLDGCHSVSVTADETALTAIVQQLVDNALAFTPQDGTIWLSSTHIAGHARFSVTDNGPGIAADHLLRILEPFEQAGRGTTEHKAGAGLGLTLAKALTELHGGALQVESTLGHGFAAIVTLPG